MHKFNRAAFFGLNASSPLVKLYLRLVALEMALKDTDPSNYSLGHDVIQMVQNRNDPALSALATALHAALAGLHCTDRRGRPATVSPAKYPDLRYLRHDSDFPGTTTDGALATALQALEDLITELARHGVRP